jgi:hypothetical protein
MTFHSPRDLGSSYARSSACAISAAFVTTAEDTSEPSLEASTPWGVLVTERGRSIATISPVEAPSYLPASCLRQSQAIVVPMRWQTTTSGPIVRAGAKGVHEAGTQFVSDEEPFVRAGAELR